MCQWLCEIYLRGNILLAPYLKYIWEKKMASVPRNRKDFLREIERMEEEIAVYELDFDKIEREYMEIDRTVREVKLLQDKARHVIRCNERKSEQYREEMEEIGQCFESCKDVKSVECNDSFNDLLAKIGQMKKTKMKLEDDLNNQKRKYGQLGTMLPELTKKCEEIKEECEFGNIKSEI